MRICGKTYTLVGRLVSWWLFASGIGPPPQERLRLPRISRVVQRDMGSHGAFGPWGRWVGLPMIDDDGVESALAGEGVMMDSLRVVEWTPVGSVGRATNDRR